MISSWTILTLLNSVFRNLRERREPIALPKGLIEIAMSELKKVGEDIKARQLILEKVSLILLDRPALGAQLVEQLYTAKDGSDEFENLVDIFDSSMNEARLALEKNRKKGSRFIETVTSAVLQADEEKHLYPFLKLVLARSWSQIGLSAPEVLEMHSIDYVLEQDSAEIQDSDIATDMLESVFEDLIKQTSEEPAALHTALKSAIPAMPPRMRTELITWSVTHSDPTISDLVCLWLLDSLQEIRLTAAVALEKRVRHGTLSEVVYRKLVVLRSWMPDDDARAKLDSVLRIALRSISIARSDRMLWTITDIRATLPDGGGTQSIMVGLRGEQDYRAAIILLKEGYGIKEAYSFRCPSLAELRKLIRETSAETGALQPDVDWLWQSLAMALTDGLSLGKPPAPGLVELVEAFDFLKLTPQPCDYISQINALPITAQILERSARSRNQLINQSDTWWENHVLLKGWFEESDELNELMARQKNPQSLERAVWQWLEGRRGFWTRLLVRSAALLCAAKHPDAMSFTATALALIDGRNLKQIPFMEDVHFNTIQAWVFESVADARSEEFEEIEFISKPPEVEKNGELDRLLTNAEIAADWIEGFLMAVTIAPKEISPNRWFPEILGAAMDVLEPDRLQRFVELITLRFERITEQASSEASLLKHFQQLNDVNLYDWSEGFSYACDVFSGSWTSKSTSNDDRNMRKLIANAGFNGFDLSAQKLLSQWIVARHAASRRLHS